MLFEQDVAVVGGCGHVGLPLAIAFANAGRRTTIYDIDRSAVDTVRAGRLPFREPGGENELARAQSSGNLTVSSDPAVIAGCEHVVVVIGTPVDEHLNPDPGAVPSAVTALGEHLRDGQLLVLRSTIYPGVTRLVERAMRSSGKRLDVAFCPERIAEGKAFEELSSLPQIVSGCSPGAEDRAARLFKSLTDEVVTLSPEGAELAKLFTNSWRYIKFAAANQFFMMANDHGVDFDEVRRALAYNYPRAADLPGAGFAAGPCLFKDTMQLAAFHRNNFALGHAAMLVNEGLPMYLVDQIERRFELGDMTVGILGMAFKADSDDVRSSLSYKLKRILGFRAKAVICTDPFVTSDASLLPMDLVVDRADLLVIGAPHDEYRHIETDRPVIDVWNLRGAGVLT